MAVPPDVVPVLIDDTCSLSCVRDHFPSLNSFHFLNLANLLNGLFEQLIVQRQLFDKFKTIAVFVFKRL